jgi:uncharacterized protein (DUF1810 family)
VDDPYGLERFVAAQEDVYAQALRELKAGRKTSHWMWFIFPQIAGLGRSGMAERYAIASLNEARAYLNHPMLGPRLVECAEAVAAHPDRTAGQIMGPTDAMKLRSSMTLFLRADPSRSVFATVLDLYYGGEPDAKTDQLLRSG